MPRINKSDLIEAVSAEAGLPKTVVGGVVDRLIAEIERATEAGAAVSISKFGVFDVRSRPARLGRNPKTGAEIEIPASAALRFRPAKRAR